MFTSADYRAVYTILRVGSYEMPIVRRHEGAWTETAKYVVEDVTAWVEANRSLLATYSANR